MISIPESHKKMQFPFQNREKNPIKTTNKKKLITFSLFYFYIFLYSSDEAYYFIVGFLCRMQKISSSDATEKKIVMKNWKISSK